MNQKKEILSAKEVVYKIGLSRVTIWRMEMKGDFPRRIILSTRRVGWKANEIEKWIETRQRI